MAKIGSPLQVTERVPVSNPVLLPTTSQTSANVPVQKIDYMDYGIGQTLAKSGQLVSQELGNMVDKVGQAAIYIDQVKKQHDKVKIGSEWNALTNQFEKDMASTRDLSGREKLYSQYTNQVSELEKATAERIGGDHKSQAFLAQLGVDARKSASTAYAKIENQRFTQTDSALVFQNKVLQSEIGNKESINITTALQEGLARIDQRVAIGSISPDVVQLHKDLFIKQGLINRSELMGRSLARDYASDPSSMPDTAAEMLAIFKGQFGDITLSEENHSVAYQSFLTTFHKEVSRQNSIIIDQEKTNALQHRKSIKKTFAHFGDLIAKGTLTEEFAEKAIKSFESRGLHSQAVELREKMDGYFNSTQANEMTVAKFTQPDSEGYLQLVAEGFMDIPTGLWDEEGVQAFLKAQIGQTHPATITKIMQILRSRDVKKVEETIKKQRVLNVLIPHIARSPNVKDKYMGGQATQSFSASVLGTPAWVAGQIKLGNVDLANITNAVMRRVEQAYRNKDQDPNSPFLEKNWKAWEPQEWGERYRELVTTIFMEEHQAFQKSEDARLHDVIPEFNPDEQQEEIEEVDNEAVKGTFPQNPKQAKQHQTNKATYLKRIMEQARDEKDAAQEIPDEEEVPEEVSEGGEAPNPLDGTAVGGVVKWAAKVGEQLEQGVNSAKGSLYRAVEGLPKTVAGGVEALTNLEVGGLTTDAVISAATINPTEQVSNVFEAKARKKATDLNTQMRDDVARFLNQNELTADQIAGKDPKVNKLANEWIEQYHRDNPMSSLKALSVWYHDTFSEVMPDIFFNAVEQVGKEITALRSLAQKEKGFTDADIEGHMPYFTKKNTSPTEFQDFLNPPESQEATTTDYAPHQQALNDAPQMLEKIRNRGPESELGIRVNEALNRVGQLILGSLGKGEDTVRYYRTLRDELEREFGKVIPSERKAGKGNWQPLYATTEEYRQATGLPSEVSTQENIDKLNFGQSTKQTMQFQTASAIPRPQQLSNLGIEDSLAGYLKRVEADNKVIGMHSDPGKNVTQTNYGYGVKVTPEVQTMIDTMRTEGKSESEIADATLSYAISQKSALAHKRFNGPDIGKGFSEGDISYEDQPRRVQELLTELEYSTRGGLLGYPKLVEAARKGDYERVKEEMLLDPAGQGAPRRNDLRKAYFSDLVPEEQEEEGTMDNVLAALGDILSPSSAYAATEEQGPSQYVIQSGDTLSEIARDTKIPMEQLMQLNQIADPNKIWAGQTLQLPEVGQSQQIPFRSRPLPEVGQPQQIPFRSRPLKKAPPEPEKEAGFFDGFFSSKSKASTSLEPTMVKSARENLFGFDGIRTMKQFKADEQVEVRRVAKIAIERGRRTGSYKFSYSDYDKEGGKNLSYQMGASDIRWTDPAYNAKMTIGEGRVIRHKGKLYVADEVNFADQRFLKSSDKYTGGKPLDQRSVKERLKFILEEIQDKGFSIYGLGHRLNEAFGAGMGKGASLRAELGTAKDFGLSAKEFKKIPTLKAYEKDKLAKGEINKKNLGKVVGSEEWEAV